MANSSQFLVSPAPLGLASNANGFVSQWVDKRSATSCGVSVVFYGATPDGYAWLEVSNAPEQQGFLSLPNNGGDDAIELASSQQNIALNAISGNYGTSWQVINCPARWLRVRYTASASVSGLSVNVYVNVPFESA
jgi:hypothetical protein